MSTVLASKVRKGTKVLVDGVIVRVTKREKWNTKDVKIHFEDCGHGLPLEPTKVYTPSYVGSSNRAVTAKFFRLTDLLETK